MDRAQDPFMQLAVESLADDMVCKLSREATVLVPSIGRLQGFDLLDQPLVAQLAVCPGQVLTARSTVLLQSAMRGREVLVLFADGDVQSPIIVGVIEPQALSGEAAPPEPITSVLADSERQVIQAEREIVLRCGDASITLTRAGKVIIRGSYILSRATGYNKIKGAAIDIN